MFTNERELREREGGGEEQIRGRDKYQKPLSTSKQDKLNCVHLAPIARLAAY